MRIDTLTLRDFRNITQAQIKWHPEFNFLYGQNAQGKTNILEALHLLSRLKSFRTTDRSELVRQNAESAVIDGIIQQDDLQWNARITLTPTSRQVALNGKKSKSQAEYASLLPLILFEPQDIYLFRNAPSDRRKALNQAVFLQNPVFLALFTEYETVVKQKNRLLKDRADPELIAIWNDRLITTGAKLTAARLKLLGELADSLAAEYEAIAKSGEQLIIRYHCAAIGGALEGVPAEAELAQSLSEAIKRRYFDELERGESLVGPHRDDMTAFLDARSLGRFGSQGENRSAIIAFKLAQLKAYAQTHKRTPLFLLDDVASELDEARCQHLFTYLAKESAQVFITTTEKRLNDAEFQGHSQAFLVRSGTIEPIV